MKTKMIEAKCHEEKLKLQQKHDADVQKVGYIAIYSFINIEYLKYRSCYKCYMLNYYGLC